MTKNRFDFVKYDAESVHLSDYYKAKFQQLEAALVIDFNEHSGRSFATALTKLEEAYMWVGKTIRDAQLERNALSENAIFDGKPDLEASAEFSVQREGTPTLAVDPVTGKPE